jgi:hypothetical protein
MRTQSSNDAVGLIELSGRINTQVEELTVRAMLEDLPGVYAVDFSGEKIEVHYNPDLAGEHKFARAVRRAGFVPAAFYPQ